MSDRTMPDISVVCQALLHEGTRNLIASESQTETTFRFELGHAQLELFEAIRSGRKLIVDKENAPQIK